MASGTGRRRGGSRGTRSAEKKGTTPEEPVEDLEPVTERTPADVDELAVRVAQPVAGLQRSSSGTVLASAVKRALLRKDPTFSDPSTASARWTDDVLARPGRDACARRGVRVWETTTAKAVLRLLDLLSGSISLNGRDITTMSQRELRPLRRTTQMVYQDPYESLDHRFRVSQVVEEPLLIHGGHHDSVVPRRDPRERLDPRVLRGETPNPVDVPAGCRFHPRSPVVRDECRVTDPQLRAVPGAPDHRAVCVLIGT